MTKGRCAPTCCAAKRLTRSAPRLRRTWPAAVRAAADQFLQTFRAQSVVFVPVNPARISQLAQLKADPSSVLIGKPQFSNAHQPRAVNSEGELATAAGFTPQASAFLPAAPTSTDYSVIDHTSA